MIRPPAIVRYEQFYIASFVLSLAASALSWHQRAAMMAANPMLATMTWYLPLTQAIGIALAALLWYFTARRPSAIAKWVVVVFAGFAALGAVIALFTLVAGSTPFGVGALLSLVGNALYITAATLLFKPDARLWFGELPETDDEVLP